MKIDSHHGRCRDCGGNLEIVDADEATMTVECERGHSYPVEHAAFGDVYMLNIIGFLAEQRDGGGT
jgi:hypothetical protein